MAYDMQLDPLTRDLILDDIVLIDGPQRVRQQIRITLLTFLGEWFLDTSFGVPYLESVLVKTPQRAEIEAILKARILDVPDVTGVSGMTIGIDRQARKLSVEFVATTPHGDLPISV